MGRLDSTQNGDNASNLHSRLEKLSQFQTHILSHVLTFPKVEVVVYSTCSVHEEENERVVERVHEKFKDRCVLITWSHVFKFNIFNFPDYKTIKFVAEF